jgi:hypothetical protein
MRAFILHRRGRQGAVLEDIGQPDPGPDQALTRPLAVSRNRAAPCLRDNGIPRFERHATRLAIDLPHPPDRRRKDVAPTGDPR